MIVILFRLCMFKFVGKYASIFLTYQYSVLPTIYLKIYVEELVRLNNLFDCLCLTNFISKQTIYLENRTVAFAQQLILKKYISEETEIIIQNNSNTTLVRELIF